MSGIKNKTLTKKDDFRKLMLFCLLAFGLTLAGTLIAAAINGLFPFGTQSVYFSDLASEYSTYLTELWRKLHEGGSIVYSWRTALGGSFWGNIFYYVSSPLNLIALIGKESAIDETVAALIYFRQALAAAFMCFFLSRRRNGTAGPVSALCGILYAFCGWFCAYYFCTIWLDIFVLLPLMLLGIEKIIDEGRPGLYIAALTVMLFSNFYMTYFACVFAILYWLFYFFTYHSFSEYTGEDENRKKVPFLKSGFFRAGVLFAGSSVLSVLMLAVFFVPLLLQMSRNTANLDVSSKAQYFTNITQQISALFSGAEFKSNHFKNYPAAYTGVLSVAALPLLFFNKKISRKEKITSAVLLGIMVLSFNIPMLDYAWHGFRFPTNFPFREAYFFSAVALILVYRLLTNIDGIPKISFITFGAGFVILIGSGVMEKLTRSEGDLAISYVDIAITAVLFICCCVALAVLSKGKKEQCISMFVLLFIFTMFDVTSTFSTNVQLLDWDQPTLDGERQRVEGILDKMDSGAVFERTELCTSWMLNDGSYFDYNGIRQSSSMTAYSTFKLLNDLGLDSNVSNFANYNMQTPVFNSFFGVNNVIERESYADYISASYMSCLNESYRIAETFDSYSVYDFGKALPLGFAADKGLADWKAEEYSAPENQNTLFSAASGLDEDVIIYCDEDERYATVSEEVEVTKTAPHTYFVENTAVGGNGYTPGVELTVTAKTDGMLYVFAQQTADEFSNIVLHVANTVSPAYTTFTSYSTSFFGAVYGAKKGESLKISAYPEQGVTSTIILRVFQIDSDVFNKEYEEIAKGGLMELTELTDTHFSGTVNVEEDDRILCVSVPYDPGWTVKLDGKELGGDDYSLIGGALYGIPVEKGGHTVEFDFALQGLLPGLAISLAAVAGTVVLFVLKRRRCAVQTERKEEADEE